MEFATQVEIAADIIWIRLHANGEMMLRKLKIFAEDGKVTLLSGYRLAGKRWKDIRNEDRLE